MYLTQLRLDPRSALARRDLADPYDMHRTLVRAFVRDEHSTPPRFLWRLEPSQAWDQPVVLVQSEYVADWSGLSAFRGYLRDDGNPETKHFDPATVLHAGTRYRFRLVANPTVSREGKRHGLVGEEAQLAWLHRQGKRWGFSTEFALTSGRETLQARKGSMRVSLLRVVFEGVLNVEDSGGLANAVAAGIGPGKAFGCGLLSLARCP